MNDRKKNAAKTVCFLLLTALLLQSGWSAAKGRSPADGALGRTFAAVLQWIG